MLAFCCYSSTALAGGYSFVTLALTLGTLPGSLLCGFFICLHEQKIAVCLERISH
jgi:hypothetical protein